MQQLSRTYIGQFDNLSALKELYIYVTRYYDAVSVVIEIKLEIFEYFIEFIFKERILFRLLMTFL